MRNGVNAGFSFITINIGQNHILLFCLPPKENVFNSV